VKHRYWVESQELWSANDRGVTWHGRPDGKRVEAAVIIPGTDDAAVILDPEGGPRNALSDPKSWPHLVRVRPDGEVVWRVAAGANAGDRDWWTAIEAVDGDLVATTWSGDRRILDPTTGLALSATFTR
jgi:hypothetical protein